MYLWTVSSVLLAIIITISAADKPCSPRKYQYDSVNCVCNSSYCDEISKIQKLPAGKYLRYTSDLELRFHRTEGSITYNPRNRPAFLNLFELFNLIWGLFTRQEEITLKIDRNIKYQPIFGFGAGFTDSSGINIKNVSKANYDHIMRSYFSEDGIELNIGRVPIGGTDFSTRPYAYNMLPENDFKLSNFSLAMEDYEYKIPLIKDAQKLATDELYLVCATWSPPLWMKTRRSWTKFGHLLLEHYQTYADYHIKFLEEYDKMGLRFWAMSTTNEPTTGNYLNINLNNVGWLPRFQAKWLEENLYPSLNGSKYRGIKIMAFDDNINLMSIYLPKFAENKVAWSYVDFIAIHYYMDPYVPDAVITAIQKTYSEKFIINTESIAGDLLFEGNGKPAMGKWARAEYLIKRMTSYFHNWSTGWIDWNMALNLELGPLWPEGQPPIEALMYVDAEKDEILKSPGFYAFGHFSKFVPRGSVRIHSDILTGSVYNTAFLRPDNGVAIVLFNDQNFEKHITIFEEGIGYIDFTMSPRSIHSVVYWKE